MRWLAAAFGTLTLLSSCGDTATPPAPEADHGFSTSGAVREKAVDGQQAKLSWTAPRTTADGAPLREAPGFKVHIGRASGAYDSVVDVGKATSYVFAGLEPETTYFTAVSAYDSSGRESQLSGEIVFATNAAPGRAPASGSDYVIGTGRLGGGYYRVGNRLKDLLVKQGSSAEVLSTSGSLENLEQLRSPSSPVNIAFSQADALNYFLKERPDFTDRFLTVDSWGSECVFIIARRDSGIRTDANLLAKANVRMAILSPKSGVSVTFRNMSLLEPAFSNVRVLYMDTAEALANLSGPRGGGKVDAVMLVQHPKARPPEMKTVLENLALYSFVQIKNDGLQDRLPDGARVYSHVDITPEPMSGIGVQTICTKRLMLASKNKLSPERTSAVSALVQRRWRDVYVAP